MLRTTAILNNSKSRSLLRSKSHHWKDVFQSILLGMNESSRIWMIKQPQFLDIHIQKKIQTLPSVISIYIHIKIWKTYLPLFPLIPQSVNVKEEWELQHHSIPGNKGRKDEDKRKGVKQYVKKAFFRMQKTCWKAYLSN